MNSIDRRRIAIVLFVACLAEAFGEGGSTVQAQSPDGAVLHALKQADRSLGAARVWHRVPLDDRQDLVLALGATGQQFLWPESGEGAFWGTQQKLGIFLQDRAQPGRVFALTVAEGPPDCAARVLRATITDTVIACSGEKSDIYPNQKFVYDVRAKRLVGHFDYAPYSDFTIRRTGAGRARVTASSDTRQVTIDYAANTSEFRIVGANGLAEPTPHRTTFVPIFPLSSSPFGPAGAFTLIEIDEVTECPSADRVVLETAKGRRRHHVMPPSDCDRIGPSAIEGDRLWFGKAFYSGEGNTGTGGFGYFDASSKTFRTFSPREIREGSTTAILVQPDAIWLALAVHGEWGSVGQGIVRYDRGTNTVTHLEIGTSLGRAFVALGDRILLALDNGILVIRDGSVKGYIVDKTSDGRLRVAEAFK